jgi:hypothetical protein
MRTRWLYATLVTCLLPLGWALLAPSNSVAGFGTPLSTQEMRATTGGDLYEICAHLSACDTTCRPDGIRTSRQELAAQYDSCYPNLLETYCVDDRTYYCTAQRFALLDCDQAEHLEDVPAGKSSCYY